MVFRNEAFGKVFSFESRVLRATINYIASMMSAWDNETHTHTYIPNKEMIKKKKRPKRTLCSLRGLPHEEKAMRHIYEPRNEFSRDIESVGLLFLAFLTSRTLRNDLLLFKTSSLWTFVSTA